MKNKKVTWDDVSAFIHGKNKNLIKKHYTAIGNYSQANGRSYFYAKCPFCNNDQKIYVWSFAGSGKRCEGCGAMFSWFGEAYHFKELNLESE